MRVCRQPSLPPPALMAAGGTAAPAWADSGTQPETIVEQAVKAGQAIAA
jgi:hypothetical protein